LAHVLRHLPVPQHPDLLVGTASGDDAAVWRVDKDRAFVATVDVFTPVVDDARTWGAIAAANSASDVYAMGGRPLFALNIAGWPRDTLSLDLLAEVLEGASEVAEKGKWLVVGGHTIDSAEPFFGQSVTGEVHPDQIISNDAAQPGQVIILTKAIGTGLAATMAKRSQPEDIALGGIYQHAYEAAVRSMLTLNDVAADVARRHHVRAGTDITGFGLLGHLHRLALGSGVSLRLVARSIPVLDGAFDLLDAGFVPGGTERNIEYVRSHIESTHTTHERGLNLLADPQTSGGLALCLPTDRAADVVGELIDAGLPAAIIATIEPSRGTTTMIVE
jgi:selenide, water dikinase